MNNLSPQRIVCLSAEAADWLWRIGAWERVAGVTAFFKQPAEAIPKPRVSGFSTANLNQIEELEPDLVIGFSDVQAGLMAEAMRKGWTVLGTNQRTLAEVEAALSLVGRVAEREKESERCLKEFRERLAPIIHRGAPERVYFEEWNEPLISGIAWVSELIERAGGHDVFAELRSKKAALDRTVPPEEVRQRNPELILASWCGKPVRVEEIMSRPGWGAVDAVNRKQVYEIAGEDILQPGFRLVYGYERIKHLLVR